MGKKIWLRDLIPMSKCLLKCLFRGIYLKLAKTLCRNLFKINILSWFDKCMLSWSEVSPVHLGAHISGYIPQSLTVRWSYYANLSNIEMQNLSQVCILVGIRPQNLTFLRQKIWINSYYLGGISRRMKFNKTMSSTICNW